MNSGLYWDDPFDLVVNRVDPNSKTLISERLDTVIKKCLLDSGPTPMRYTIVYCGPPDKVRWETASTVLTSEIPGIPGYSRDMISVRNQWSYLLYGTIVLSNSWLPTNSQERHALLTTICYRLAVEFAGLEVD